MARTPAWKRYNWRVVWLSLLYCAFLLPAVYGFKHQLVPHSVAYLVEEQDEYVRILMVRQTLWASGLTLSLATAWGFLDNFKLVGHIDGYWIVVVWFFGLGVGGIVNKLTLGDGGC